MKNGNTFIGGATKMIKKIILFILLVVFTIASCYFLAFVLPFPTMNESYEITIYDENDEVIVNTRYNNISSYLSIEQINPDLLVCFIASEDSEFLTHHGFSLKGSLRAFFHNLTNDSTQGGSTISQQLSRMIYYNNEKSLLRKLKEAFMTLRIETHFDKQEIIEQYLNNIFLGHNIYGVEQASQYYFSKSNMELSLDECALIAGIANAPNINAPDINYKNAISRKNHVLNELFKDEFIDKETLDNLIRRQTKINLNKNINDNTYRQIINYVNSFLNDKKLNNKELLSRGINVYTTISQSIHKKALDIISSYKQSDISQVSSVIIKPNSGDVLSFIGSYNLDDEYNRAFMSSRPIGSTVKPLLYYLALKCDMTPLTLLDCSKTTFNIKQYGLYSPENATHTYATKPINMIEAIGLSDNIYATKTLLYVGVDNLTHLYSLFDFNTTCVPSSSLGVDEMSLLKLTSIYNCFASTGNYYKPRVIRKVEDKYKNQYYFSQSSKKKILSTRETLIINQMLTASFDDNLIDYTIPTLLNYKPKFKMAAKTGSTASDTYTIGFNPNYTFGIWAGTDNNEILSNTQIAKRIFKDLVNNIEDKNSWYVPTNNIEVVKINPLTGKSDQKGSIYWF